MRGGTVRGRLRRGAGSRDSSYICHVRKQPQTGQVTTVASAVDEGPCGSVHLFMKLAISALSPAVPDGLSYFVRFCAALADVRTTRKWGGRLQLPRSYVRDEGGDVSHW